MKKIASTLYKTSALYSRNTLHHARLFARLALSVTTISAIATDALALPAGGNVVSGQATITQTSPNQLTITQTTNKGIINWQGFNILNGETVNVIEPTKQSIELERVTSGSPTKILGALTSNGQIWIVNGSGVFFGAGAQINVAGMVVSTADISNKNFNTGNYVFDRTNHEKADATIINKGHITAGNNGLVALVAPAVVNDGVITAKLGTVALGSGKKFTLDFYGDGLYGFTVDAPATAAGKDNHGNTLTAAITNNGKISGANVYITADAAKTVVDQAINTSGIITATGMHKEGGTIVLDGGDNSVVVSGKLNASGKGAGTTGGSITVKGQQIDLTSTSQILATGDASGGNVLIGFNSSNPSSIPLADTTIMQQGAFIDVSSANGFGGGAEVSGASLNYAGLTSATGALGMGTLTLNSGSSTIWSGANGANTLNTGTLETQLNNSNVNIYTTASGTGQTQDINVVSDILWGGSGSLNLNAGNNINVSANIEASYSGASTQGAIGMLAANDLMIGFNGSDNNNASSGGNGSNIFVSTNSGAISLTALNGMLIGGNGGDANGAGKFKFNSGNGGGATVTSDSGAIAVFADNLTLGGNGGSNNGNFLSAFNGNGGNGAISSTSGDITLTITDNLNLGGSAGTGNHGFANGIGGSGSISTGGNITADTQNVSMINHSAMTAGATSVLAINNTGVFFSDASDVLRGGLVTLNQSAAGSIQNAINAISFFDVGSSILTLDSGTWNEEVKIDRNNLILTGQGAGSIINATQNHSSIVLVDGNADTVSNLTLDANGETGVTGIKVKNVSGVDIFNNTLNGNGDGTGITLFNVSNTSGMGGGVFITGNTISGFGTGINVKNTFANVIGNMLLNDSTGINVTGGDNTIIAHNTISGADTGIDVNGSAHVNISYNKIFDSGTGILVENGSNGATIANNLVAHNDDGIVIDGSDWISVYGNSIYHDADGIVVDDSNHVRVAHNRIAYAGVGINVEDSKHVDLYKNRISAVGTGIYADYANDLRVADNSITDIGTGIILKNSGWAMLLGNSINNTRFNGIYASNDWDLSVEDNTVEHASRDGIYVDHLRGTNSIDGNTVKNSENGIVVRNSRGVAVDSNSVFNNSNDGILIEKSKDITVSNNLVAHNGDGIVIDGSDWVSVYGNGVYHDADGIVVDDSNHIRVAHNRIAHAGVGIDVDGSSHVDLYKNRISSVGTGIYADRANGLRVVDNSIRNVGTGIILKNSGWATLLGNSINHTRFDGIYASNDWDLNIDDNSIGTAHHSRIGGDGIEVKNSNGVSIDGNTIEHALHNGIYVAGLGTDHAGNGNTIDGNIISDIRRDGILAGNSASLGITNNQIGNVRTGIAAKDVAGLLIGDLGAGNSIENTTGDGIDVYGSPSASISFNTLSAIGGAGILVGSDVNDIASDDVNIAGNSINGAATGISVSGLTDMGGNGNIISGNIIDHITADGIDASAAGLTISGNSIGTAGAGSIGGNGIFVTGSDNAFIAGNTVSNAADVGIWANASNNVNLASNTVFGTGTGMLISGSDNASVNGGLLSGNGIGLDISDSQNATINSVMFAQNDTGLFLQNGSRGTLLFSNIFSDINVDVLIDGSGATTPGTSADMQFGDNNNVFTSPLNGSTFYFVLQNGGMFGETLDASRQTFGGVVAANFTLNEFAAAEDRTIDSRVDPTLGMVFYKSFPSSALLSQLVQKDAIPYLGALFSYAGQTLGTLFSGFNGQTFGAGGTAFTVETTNLSMLAGGGVPPAGSTPQQLADLSPAAGGADAAYYASLAPAAGGNMPITSGSPQGCANSFLNDSLNGGCNNNK